MMGLPQKSFQNFVDDMVAAWAAALEFKPTLQTGDALYALMQSTAGQLVFIQAQVQLVNALARAQTTGSDLKNGTTDADLDSFYAQFGFTRLQGQFAEGPVILSKASPAGAQVLIPVGTVVQTVGGAVQYALVADTNQPTFDPSQDGYVLQIGQTSLAATAKALVSGSSYDVTVGQLAQIATPVPGIDTVTNAVPISNGADAEPNPAFRTRFVLFINSLSKATYGAIVSAISGVQQGVEFSLQENVDVNGTARLGEFVATIDDGTGSPSAALLAAVFAAVDSVRGFTIMPEVVAVTVVHIDVVIVVKLDAGASAQVVEAAVGNAVVAAINANDIGATLYVSTVEAAALAVDGVVAVRSGTTLNGMTADLSVTGFQATRSDINRVTVSTY